MAYSVPYNLLGMQLSGDLGGETIYTDRYGKKVAFPKSPPKTPPSPAQVLQRTAFRNAQQTWSQLTYQQKLAIENATKKLSLCLTGQNLWIHLLLCDGSKLRDTIERQSGILLPLL